MQAQTTTCLEAHCERPVLARGRCSLHYQRWRKQPEYTPNTNWARVDLVGQRFGRWEVIEDAGRHRNGYVLWLCRCDCGNSSVVPSHTLKSGDSRSCGCLRKTGHHGRQKSSTYWTWMSMLSRVRDPRNSHWKYYGGRGITVCDRWNPRQGGSFVNFLTDMGEKPANPEHWVSKVSFYSLDRRDNDGNYEPGNCRWATAKEQMANRKTPVMRGCSIQGCAREHRAKGFCKYHYDRR